MQASDPRGGAAAPKALARAPSLAACSEEERMGWGRRRRASSSRRRRKTLACRAVRRPASVARQACSAAQMAHDASESRCSWAGSVDGNKSLAVVEGLRGGRDSGAIVVFVFGLGCPSRSLPGRQHSPAKRALQATRGALRAVTRCNSHQFSNCNLGSGHRIVLCTLQSQRSSPATRTISYRPLSPHAPSPMETTAPAPNSPPVDFPT